MSSGFILIWCMSDADVLSGLYIILTSFSWLNSILFNSSDLGMPRLFETSRSILLKAEISFLMPKYSTLPMKHLPLWYVGSLDINALSNFLGVVFTLIPCLSDEYIRHIASVSL